MAILMLILGLLLFIGLVVVHELGHFWVARRNDVDVEEFGIGFPPRAKLLAEKHKTVYTLNWLPLGGFVRLKGEHDIDDRPHSFGAASLKTKVKIMLAGVIMNFLTAIVLFTILALFGMPKANLSQLPFYDKEQFTVASDTKITSNVVYVSVINDSPASRAGLKSGDQIISIQGERIKDAQSLPSITERNRGKKAEVIYRRGSNPVSKTSALINTERSEDKGYLGVAPIDSQTFKATWSAPVVGVMTTLQYTEVSFRGLGYIIESLFAGEHQAAGEAVGGPVATFKVISDTSSLGLGQLLFVISLISVSLAVMNILPIPALDGGRLFVTLLYRAFRWSLTPAIEDRIHGTGFVVLIGLIMFITVLDIRRFF